MSTEKRKMRREILPKVSDKDLRIPVAVPQKQSSAIAQKMHKICHRRSSCLLCDSWDAIDVASKVQRFLLAAVVHNEYYYQIISDQCLVVNKNLLNNNYYLFSCCVFAAKPATIAAIETWLCRWSRRLRDRFARWPEADSLEPFFQLAEVEC